MARQILMACLIFNGFESGATAHVLMRFALLEQLSPVILDAARTVRASSDMILIQIRMLCGGLHVLQKGTDMYSCLHGASKNVRVR